MQYWWNNLISILHLIIPSDIDQGMIQFDNPFLRMDKFSIIIEVDDPCEECCPSSICIRLNWPGIAEWRKQFRTKDPPRPITKAQLTKNIVLCIQNFIKDNAGQPISDEEDNNAPSFRVGHNPNDIKLEDFTLVCLDELSRHGNFSFAWNVKSADYVRVWHHLLVSCQINFSILLSLYLYMLTWLRIFFISVSFL